MSISRFCGLIFCFLLVASCNRVEGCLEADASNFDPAADKNCCCEYPNLTFEIYPQSGSVEYVATDILTDFTGNEYQVNEVQLYISNPSLIQADGTISKVTDSLTISLEDGSGNSYEERIEDSYMLFSSGTSSYESGSFSSTDAFERLQFFVGVDPLANQANPDLFEEEDHALGLQDPEMYEEAENSYLFIRAEVLIAGEVGPRVYKVFGDDALKELQINYATTSKQAFDTQVSLNMDVKALFDTVDFLSDSENIITQKIVDNLDLVFSQRF